MAHSPPRQHREDMPSQRRDLQLGSPAPAMLLVQILIHSVFANTIAKQT